MCLGVLARQHYHLHALRLCVGGRNSAIWMLETYKSVVVGFLFQIVLSACVGVCGCVRDETQTKNWPFAWNRAAADMFGDIFFPHQFGTNGVTHSKWTESTLTLSFCFGYVESVWAFPGVISGRWTWYRVEKSFDKHMRRKIKGNSSQCPDSNIKCVSF